MCEHKKGTVFQKRIFLEKIRLNYQHEKDIIFEFFTLLTSHIISIAPQFSIRESLQINDHFFQNSF